ncbi:MAG TPA: hypothetical protein VFC46_06405, partial [Humisphaera sp.]|nr:hypothetical protein [Humisphaera sp.]
LGLTVFAYQHSSTVADRYLYLPMVGVALIVAWALDQVPSPTPGEVLPRGVRATRFGSLIGCAVILPLLGIQTYFQTDIWHDTQTLFDTTRHAINRRPGAMQEDDGRKSSMLPQSERYFHK